MYSEDPVPPYEESIHSYSTAITTSTHPDTKPAPPSTLSTIEPALSATPSLNNRLLAARGARISELLAQHIDPLLHETASAGLSKTTLVLVPTPDAAPAAHAPSSAGESDLIAPRSASEEVVGLPADAHPHLVRLRDPAHGERFWRQPAAVRELEASLKARLAAAGHRVYAPREVVVEAQRPAPVTAPPKRKGSWFGSRRSSARDEAPAAGYRGAEEPERRVELRERPLEPGEVNVGVGLKDVAVRAETGIGLYETRSGKAVVVGVEVG